MLELPAIRVKEGQLVPSKENEIKLKVICGANTQELEGMTAEGQRNIRTKKESLQLERERQKLENYLGGIKEMNAMPNAMFVVDSRKEAIAIKEAKRLGIPVVAVVDTNCDPEGIDYVIPGNDDAIRAIKLFVTAMSDACLEGRHLYEESIQAATDKEQVEPDAVKPSEETAAQEQAV